MHVRLIDIAFMLPVIFVYTMIILRLGYSWGLREKEARAEAPVLPRRSPGRHAAGYRPPPDPEPAPGETEAPVLAPRERPSLPLLQRVREGLRALNEDDDPQEARSPGFWADEAAATCVEAGTDRHPDQSAYSPGYAPDETSQVTAVLPAAEGAGDEA